MLFKLAHADGTVKVAFDNALLFELATEHKIAGNGEDECNRIKATECNSADNLVDEKSEDGRIKEGCGENDAVESGFTVFLHNSAPKEGTEDKSVIA